MFTGPAVVEMFSEVVAEMDADTVTNVVADTIVTDVVLPAASRPLHSFSKQQLDSHFVMFIPGSLVLQAFLMTNSHWA